MLWEGTGKFVILVTWVSTVTYATHDARRLHDTILRKNNYNKFIWPRPVSTDAADEIDECRQYNKSLTVRMGLRLAQILGVDTRNEFISLNVFVVQKWCDYRLKWNPKEYGDIEMVHIPSEDIWLPDIVLYNNGDGDYPVTLRTPAQVFHTGLVIWEPPSMYQSLCNINVEYFPIDQQQCHMKFGTWTYDGDVIDLVHINWNSSTPYNSLIDPGMDLSIYCPSNEWDIMATVARKSKIFYTCCPEPYIDITYNFTVRRKNSHFYTVNILVPIVSINMLTLLAFNLPAECHEKISLCISILLSLGLFQLVIMDFMPHTSLTLPLLAKYIVFTNSIVTISVASSVIVLNVHFRSTMTHRMSYITRKLFVQILPRLLLMQRPNKKMRKVNRKDFNWSLHQSDLANYENPYKSKFKPINCDRYVDEDELYNGTGTLHQTTFVGIDTSGADFDSLCTACAERKTYKFPPNALKAMDGASFIAQHLYEVDERKKVEFEWKYVGLVVDRLLLWIYTAVCIVGCLGILLNAPTLYDDTVPLCDRLTRACKCRMQ